MIQAIITGDLIHSTRLKVEDREWLFEEITQALEIWDKDFGTRSETFRGDSFQCLVKRPADALRICLIQKTFIRSLNPSSEYELTKRNNPSIKRGMIYPNWIFDARIAIGIGETDKLLNRLAASGGKAFELSGQLLDKMKSKKQALAIATTDEFNDELQTEFVLLDALISKTTALQCEVINYKLLKYTETEIAHKLGIMQSAVNQRSNNGNWNAIDAMIKRFEKIYSNEK
jgi:hypothetical protein